MPVLHVTKETNEKKKINSSHKSLTRHGSRQHKCEKCRFTLALCHTRSFTHSLISMKALSARAKSQWALQRKYNKNAERARVWYLFLNNNPSHIPSYANCLRYFSQFFFGSLTHIYTFFSLLILNNYCSLTLLCSCSPFSYHICSEYAHTYRWVCLIFKP